MRPVRGTALGRSDAISLLAARGLVKAFDGRSGGRAVDDVSFELERGETLALVGESGAGKSTTARLVLRLIEPDAGSVIFDGADLLSLRPKKLRGVRQSMQIVFQDPFGSLNPRMPIAQSVAEPLEVHGRYSRAERAERVRGLLERVGIGSRFFSRYPGQLSGGQLQRIAIARALALQPKLIVCDEPVAALDVSVRAQVLILLKELQQEFDIALLFISHDLALVEVLADRVGVMRRGQIVEEGTVAELFSNPRTDYTRELLRAIPRPAPGRLVRKGTRRQRLVAELPVVRRTQ